MREDMRICAIIVTHNRPNFLSRLLDALIQQTRPPDFYIVVDDLDSPNVKAIIANKLSGGKFRYLRMSRNFGLFGGLYIGLKEALKLGYDAMWLLDDDCVPEKDALEKLVTIVIKKGLRNCVIYPAHIDDHGYFTEPVAIKAYQGQWFILERLSKEFKGKLFETTGGPNIGPLLMRQVIELAGLPRPDLFFCGEYEYFQRIHRSGCKIYRYFDAVIYHKRHKFKRIRLPSGRTTYVSIVPLWHDYYEIRNYIFTIKYQKGWKDFFYHLLALPLYIIIKVIFNDKRLRRLIILIKAVADGISGNLKMRIVKDAED